MNVAYLQSKQIARRTVLLNNNKHQKGHKIKNKMKSFFQKHSILANVLLIISTLAISSCDKEEMGNNKNINNNNDNDNYYVKYAISSMYPRIFSNWSVTTPEGKYTRNGYQTRRWEQTYGPVKKGFKCEVQVKNGEPTIEIHVSINQEPFALKTSENGSSASYTIN